MCTRMQNDHTRTLKILKSMSEFDGVCKHQNNPACIKSVRVFKMLKMDIYTKTKKPLSRMGARASINQVQQLHFNPAAPHTGNRLQSAISPSSPAALTSSVQS